MADPFRLRVMKNVCDALKTITPANGYQNDLADYVDSAGRPNERVFRGRDIFGESDGIPLLTVLEDPRAPDANNGSLGGPQANNTFRLLIQGFVRDDKMHPLDAAYQLSAEVTKCLVALKADQRNILGLGWRAPCVTSLSVGQPVHRPGRDEISENAYLLVGLTLVLAENLERPFD